MVGSFVFLFVVVLFIGVVATMFFVGQAHDLADRTGQSRGRAAWRVLSSRSAVEELRQMEHEASLRDELAHQRALLERATKQGGLPAPGQPTSEQRLKQVQQLYEQGLINEDEASQKRREILDEL